MPSRTTVDLDRIRCGYHGSADLVRRLLHDAGLDDEEVALSQYDVTDPFRALRSGELDVMTVKFQVREPDLAVSPVLAHDARAAVVGTAHPLAGRASVSIEELAAYETFARPGRMPAYVWDEVVPPHTPAGRPLRRCHQVSTIPQMMRLVAESTAVHISLASLADVAPPQVAIVPIHDLPGAPVAVAWRRGAELPGCVRAFVERVQRGGCER
ncbi:LysR substrate-binding domain-containing protein [Streptomyces sp. NPDC101227]|uniref:LysR substrate-binding domain-containing protein n=1 Tax=Streptomyces sp. NPDC101227 TaxID=3366136 RepID=UPI00380FE8A8